MSFQRDGWDPKWGEEGAGEEDEAASSVETRRRRDSAQPQAVARDDAWDEVDEEDALDDEDAVDEVDEDLSSEPRPAAKPEPDASLDVDTVAIPPPEKNSSSPEVQPSDTVETVPLRRDPPRAEPKSKKKNDAEEKDGTAK